MLDGTIRVLNFDDSLIKQKQLIARFQPTVIDLKSIAPAARHWVNQKTLPEIRNIIGKEPNASITFLGSGDFHHISSLLIEQFREPLSVIVFDHHPDWDILPPKIGCGSWVARILEKKNIIKVILLGVSSDDISTLSIQTGNLKSLKNDKLEIYPYTHGPSRVILRRVAQNSSLVQRRGLFYQDIYWQELKNSNLSALLLEIISRMPTKKTYVTIDKDCLSAEYSLTNWEEGYFKLDELLLCLRLIKERLEIVGLDIVGDYSLPQVQGMIKAFFSRLDHPKDFTAKGKTESEINAVNERTNLKIIEALKNLI